MFEADAKQLLNRLCRLFEHLGTNSKFFEGNASAKQRFTYDNSRFV